MDGQTNFLDWEILLPEVGADFKPLKKVSEADFEDGAIKADYFALDVDMLHHKGADFDASIHEEVLAQVGSGNPSRIDPESSTQFLDRLNLEVGCPSMDFPRNDLGGFCSDVSLDYQRSHFASEKIDLGDAGSVIGEKIVADEETVRGVGREGIGEIGGKSVGIKKPEEKREGERANSDGFYNSSVEKGDKNIDMKNVSARGGEKRVTVWWKLPFELLRLCAFRVKPVWPISIAAAILGILMLRKRLNRMKYNSTSGPLKVSLDENVKKASQLKSHAVRLNEAFSVVRRVHIIRAPLPATSLISWSIAGLQ